MAALARTLGAQRSLVLDRWRAALVAGGLSAGHAGRDAEAAAVVAELARACARAEGSASTPAPDHAASRAHAISCAREGACMADLLRAHALLRAAVHDALGAAGVRPSVAAAGQLNEALKAMGDAATIAFAEAQQARLASLAELAAYKQRVLDVAKVGSWELNLATREVVADAGFRALFGLTPDEPFSLDQGLAIIHPDDSARVARAVNDAIAGKDGGEYLAEYRTTQRPDGSMRWVEARGQARFGPDGRAQRFLGTGVDITARKRVSQLLEAEKQRFEAVFINSPAGMALLRGRDLVFELVNPRWAELVSARDYLGRPWEQVYPELTDSSLRDILARVFATGESFSASEMCLEVRAPSGRIERRYYDLSYIRLVDGDGIPHGVYCQSLDVTDRVTYRLEVEQRGKDLERAVAARDAFLGIASHELKTPLTAWRLDNQSYQRRLTRQGSDALALGRVRRLLDHSEVHARRLTRLVDDMLDVSRINSGQLSMHFETVDLIDLVRRTVARFEAQLDAAGCAVTVEAEGTLWVHADALRLEQVLVNLLTNASKYAPGRPVEVVVEHQGEEARITVRDHGPGIAPGMQPRIFERFERLVTASEVSGLGLGLHIAREIMRAHRGDVCLTSTLGVGSAFTIIVPTVAEGRPTRDIDASGAIL